MTTISLDISPEVVETIARRAAEIVRETAAPDQWLDAKGAAEYLAVPLSTIHKLTAARAIPFSRDTPGGKLYFKRSALDEWRSSN